MFLYGIGSKKNGLYLIVVFFSWENLFSMDKKLNLYSVKNTFLLWASRNFWRKIQ